MHLEDVLGDIQTDCANLHVDDPSDVIRYQRSPYGTSMPREGVVHYIKLGLEQVQRCASASPTAADVEQPNRGSLRSHPDNDGHIRSDDDVRWDKPITGRFVDRVYH